MAFTATQVMILAEITQETKETVEAQVELQAFDAEEELWITDDLDLWESKRNKVETTLEGGSDGVRYIPKRLLDEIRERIRKALGLSLVSWEVSGTSRSVSHTVVW